MDQALKDDIADVINRHSRENASNTPDYILAEYLHACLMAFEGANQSREKWYGHKLEPGKRFELNGEEAIAGFLGWLTTRQASVTIGAAHEMPSDLVKRFYEVNKVSKARDGWEAYLTHPTREE